MIKAVLFDLDDTLLDRDASVAYFIEQQYERLRPAFDGVLKNSFVERFIELDAHGYAPKTEVYQQIVAEFGLTGISWSELLTDYRDCFDPYCINLPGLEPMLQTLVAQHRSLGIITNGPTPFQEQKIQTMGIADYFSVILVSAAEGVKKPDAVIFRRAVDKLGVKPGEAVFVGDHPRTDVQGAQAFGMKAIWKYAPHWGACPWADAICDDLAQLPDLVQQLETQIQA
jgi:putative hydrolase of the HAD superfamily